MSDKHTESDGGLRWKLWPVRGVAHLIGILATGALLAVPFVDSTSLEAMWMFAQYDGYLNQTWLELALHVSASACVWTLVVLLFEVATGRREPVRRLVGAETGSVMTETLVVLPVFLLLTFGIAQMAVNNIAGIMCDTAAFQAGRTAWLWDAETEVNRMGVDDSLVQEMTRIQAAAVITPVAPGDYVVNPFGASDQMKDMRGSLIGAQLPPGSDMGETGSTLAPVLIGAGLLSGGLMDTSFSKALDNSSFRARSARKFTTAYAGTEVELVESGDEYGAKVTYSHYQAFPIVGQVFGESATIGGRSGRYLTITREYTLPTQVKPNPTLPD